MKLLRGKKKKWSRKEIGGATTLDHPPSPERPLFPIDPLGSTTLPSMQQLLPCRQQQYSRAYSLMRFRSFR
ncbi:Acetolactate synthase small subunit [Fusarium oxysporum f. sp. albedinis]|nr:Acetolactate synthase small subunit [Fusarium oxysporum f. sp. albedinis]